MRTKPSEMVFTNLSNSFHGTTARVLIPRLIAERSDNVQRDALMWLERHRPAGLKRLRDTLCGADDCTCGIVR